MSSINRNGFIFVSVLALSACGGSSNNDSTSHTNDDSSEHEHDSITVVSQKNSDTISLLHEGTLEPLDGNASGVGSEFILSDDGQYLALLASGQVNFIHSGEEEDEEGESDSNETEVDHEEHEPEILDYSISGTKVLATAGHFSVLNNGNSTLIPLSQLEATDPAVEIINIPQQSFPAVVLNEADNLMLLFVANEAIVYENDVATEHKIACTNASSLAQAHDHVVFHCDEGNLVAAVEEGEADHTIHLELISGTETVDTWTAMGEVVAGYNASTPSSNFVILEHNETSGEIEKVETSVTVSGNICNVQIEAEAQDIILLTDNAQLTALSHEGSLIKTLSLDESQSSTCANLVLAVSAKSALVVDNSLPLVYEIDAHNGAPYHIHGRETLSENDIKSLVTFQELDSHEEHDH